VATGVDVTPGVVDGGAFTEAEAEGDDDGTCVPEGLAVTDGVAVGVDVGVCSTQKTFTATDFTTPEQGSPPKPVFEADTAHELRPKHCCAIVVALVAALHDPVR